LENEKGSAVFREEKSISFQPEKRASAIEDQKFAPLNNPLAYTTEVTFLVFFG
jgi:hypothetical protein